MTAPVTRLLNLLMRDELRELCRRMDLSSSGNMPDLKKRLRSKLQRDFRDEAGAVRSLLETSDVSVDDWRELLFDQTGTKPARSYNALVEFVVDWAEGLFDGEEDNDEGDDENESGTSALTPSAARTAIPVATAVRHSENSLLVPTSGTAPPGLTDYQREAVNALTQLTPRDPQRRGGILCLPTGSGKTKTAVWWAMEHVIARGGRVLWLAARQELVDQAHTSFVSHAPLVHRTRPLGLRVRRIVARSEEAFDGDVVVASVQTLQNRVFKGSKGLGDISAIIFDEAHHAPAPTYAELLRNLDHESRLLVGLSATPTRAAVSEQAALKRFFPAGVVFQVPYETLMHKGYLARPVHHVVSVDGDEALVLSADETAHVSTWKDLPQSALNRLAKSETRLRTIADYITRRKDELKPMLVFAINQAHAKDIQAALKQRQVNSACVLDDTPASNRAELVNALRNKQLDALVNVQVLTEGTDIPALTGVVITRPTMSRTLYQQMVGRGSRGPKFTGGTEKFFVIDFTANLSQFGDLLAYRYALDTELPREVFAPPKEAPPSGTEALISAPSEPGADEVRAAIEAALADLRRADPGVPDLPLAGWYTFRAGTHPHERTEEMLVFEPDGSAVASAKLQAERVITQTMTEEQAQAVSFEIWNRELFAHAVSLRKFLTLGEAIRLGRRVDYVSSISLQLSPIPDSHDASTTFSDDGPPVLEATPLPLWLAAHFQRGGVLTIDWDDAIEWDGDTHLGIEQTGPGLVGLLNHLDVCRVDVEVRHEGQHERLVFVATIDDPQHPARARRVVVTVPYELSSRYTDVTVMKAGY